MRNSACANSVRSHGNSLGDEWTRNAKAPISRERRIAFFWCVYHHNDYPSRFYDIGRSPEPGHVSVAVERQETRWQASRRQDLEEIAAQPLPLAASVAEASATR